MAQRITNRGGVRKKIIPRRNSPRGQTKRNNVPSDADLMKMAKDQYRNDKEFLKVIEVIISELKGPQWTVIKADNYSNRTLKSITNVSPKTLWKLENMASDTRFSEKFGIHINSYMYLPHGKKNYKTIYLVHFNPHSNAGWNKLEKTDKMHSNSSTTKRVIEINARVYLNSTALGIDIKNRLHRDALFIYQDDAASKSTISKLITLSSDDSSLEDEEKSLSSSESKLTTSSSDDSSSEDEDEEEKSLSSSKVSSSSESVIRHWYKYVYKCPCQCPCKYRQCACDKR